MIDVHTHILPKIDDGSKSAKQTAEMLKEMHSQGVETIVATPHFDMRRESVGDFLSRRQKSVELLSEYNVDMSNIRLGAEVLYLGVGLDHLEDIEKLCIEGTRYILIEPINNKWGSTFKRDILRLIDGLNIYPIIAHIERFITGNNIRMLCELEKEGVLAQSNAEFFISRKTRGRALRMLKKNIIQLLGSDCHDMNLRPPNLGVAADIICSKFGEGYVSYMMSHSKEIFCNDLQEGER